MATNNTVRAERSRFTVHVTFVVFAALLAIVATGCGLTKPAGAGFASVKIKNSTPAKIQQAAVQVFREDGYTAFEGG
ncbi:MAG TPA: hypothetical protein VMU04_15250, partial [Candidatus Acidoferrum sp.]|nr:hypothetical protein [Candidatus Acidoferrum sp.]